MQPCKASTSLLPITMSFERLTLTVYNLHFENSFETRLWVRSCCGERILLEARAAARRGAQADAGPVAVR